MTLRPVLEFDSTFPDDSIVDEDEEFVEWPGRNIADAVKAGLEEGGYSVSEPISAEHKGWELDVRRGGKRLWLQVSVVGPDENYLIAQNMTFFLWPDHQLFRTFLSDLREIVAGDPRFQRPRWFAPGGAERGAAPADRPFDN
jgi:hypothetical protein